MGVAAQHQSYNAYVMTRPNITLGTFRLGLSLNMQSAPNARALFERNAGFNSLTLEQQEKLISDVLGPMLHDCLYGDPNNAEIPGGGVVSMGLLKKFRVPRSTSGIRAHLHRDTFHFTAPLPVLRYEREAGIDHSRLTYDEKSIFTQMFRVSSGYLYRNFLLFQAWVHGQREKVQLNLKKKKKQTAANVLNRIRKKKKRREKEKLHTK